MPIAVAAFVDQVYLYAGLAVDNKHETGFIAKEIRKHNYQTMVRLFTSLDDATFRAVLWDQSVHCLVIALHPGNPCICISRFGTA